MFRVIPYRNIPILLYHRIAEEYPGMARNISTRPEIFLRHLNYLRQKGYRTLSLDDPHHREGKGGKEIIITFDDGYLDNYVTALPLLHSYGFTATFFLTTNLIGKRHSWGAEEHPLMSWQHAREMQRCGFSFGSHTCSHPDLTRLGKEEVLQELDGSRKKLEDELGIPINHFSYPFGKYNKVTKQRVIDCGYGSACSVSRTDGDLFSIERFMLTLDDGPVTFKIKASHWGSYVRGVRRKLGLSNDK